MPRFYEPTAGQILLDGTPLLAYQLANLRRQIALVSQDVVLFNDSVAANIAYGADVVDMDKVRAAAKAAHALEFIETCRMALMPCWAKTACVCLVVNASAYRHSPCAVQRYAHPDSGRGDQRTGYRVGTFWCRRRSTI